jgi:hypothetical protein
VFSTAGRLFLRTQPPLQKWAGGAMSAKPAEDFFLNEIFAARGIAYDFPGIGNGRNWLQLKGFPDYLTPSGGGDEKEKSHRH